MGANEKYFRCVFVFFFGIYFLFCAAVTEADDDNKHEKGSNEKLFAGNKDKRLKKGSGSGVVDPFSQILYFAEELGLNKEQFLKIKAARLDYKKKGIRLTADIKIANLNLRNQLYSGSINKEEILAQSDELGKLTARKIRLNTKTMVRVFTVLTPEQIKKTQELNIMKIEVLGIRMQEGS
jgi:Spy/CpxP family protein refolding chaperone